MITYSVLSGIVRLNKQYVTKHIAFCQNESEEGNFYFTRSDAGKVHGFDSAEALEERRQLLLNQGYTESPYVSL